MLVQKVDMVISDSVIKIRTKNGFGVPFFIIIFVLDLENFICFILC